MSRVKLRSGEVRESGYAKRPRYRVELVPSAKRVRCELGGTVVADSTDVKLLYETRHLPVYYFPREDVRWEHLRATDHSTFCPYKGEAHYWTVTVGDRTAENALWAYPEPFPEVPALATHVAFYWDRMDRWLEEDEEVRVHPRDPLVRVDVLASSRPVTVTLAGREVASTTRARFLFETGLPTRYYLPREDVAVALIETETRTACPYKGAAVHYAVELDGTRHDDVAWSYPAPLPEAAGIAGRVCFYQERVDGIRVDGRPLETPRTKWSR